MEICSRSSRIWSFVVNIGIRERFKPPWRRTPLVRGGVILGSIVRVSTVLDQEDLFCFTNGARIGWTWLSSTMNLSSSLNCRCGFLLSVSFSAGGHSFEIPANSLQGLKRSITFAFSASSISKTLKTFKENFKTFLVFIDNASFQLKRIQRKKNLNCSYS